MNSSFEKAEEEARIIALELGEKYNDKDPRIVAMGLMQALAILNIEMHGDFETMQTTLLSYHSAFKSMGEKRRLQ